MRTNLAALAIVAAVVVALIASVASLGMPAAQTRKQAPATTNEQPKPTKQKLSRLSRSNRVATDNQILDGFVRGLGATKHEGGAGRWAFELDGVPMMVITDERADRMRIVAAIADVDKLAKSDLATLLEANFDRALDAKYAMFNDVVWAVFTHPLSPITKAEFKSAAAQVGALVTNYGTTYSSLDVVFGGGRTP